MYKKRQMFRNVFKLVNRFIRVKSPHGVAHSTSNSERTDGAWVASCFI